MGAAAGHVLLMCSLLVCIAGTPAPQQRGAAACERVCRVQGVPACTRVRTWSIPRSGVSICGPFPLITSNSMPSAGSGVRMSLKKMTPSGLNARQGCGGGACVWGGASTGRM